MKTRQEIACEAARVMETATFPAALLGFDGFVDDIIDVVKQRRTCEEYERLPTMADFATLIGNAATVGCNVELVVKQQKLGGNGTIMASALAALGLPVTYLGAVGDGPGAIHKVFEDFARRARVIPLTDAARTHALEFTDGKIMMGELASLSQLTWARVLEVIGLEKLVALCEEARLLAFNNWTMVPHMTELWRHLAAEVLPRLSAKPRRVFIDLADPRKRSLEDLGAGLAVLTEMNRHARVTLGLNRAESQQVARAVGVPEGSDEELCGRAAAIREKLGLDTVVIHPTRGAAAATAGETAEFAGPYVAEPKILTGGGDHFNAGFATAQLLEMPLEEALCVGTATSGYYVRHAASPGAGELAGFLRELPAGR